MNSFLVSEAIIDAQTKSNFKANKKSLWAKGLGINNFKSLLQQHSQYFATNAAPARLRVSKHIDDISFFPSYCNTPEANYRLDIFAGFITESESEVYSTFFNTGSSFVNWYEKKASKSRISTGIVPEEHSRIITLSTCTYERENMRFVIMTIMRPVLPEDQ